MGRRGRADERRFYSPAASPPPPGTAGDEDPIPDPMEFGVLREGGTGELEEWEEREEDLGDALRELQERARERVARSRSSMDTWTRIEVTPEIEVSVRGIADEDGGLVERVRRAMIRLLGRAVGGE